MKLSLLKIPFLTLSTILVTNLVACQKPDRSSSSPATASSATNPLPGGAGTSTPPQAGGNTTTAEGTSHSGGGNGVNNKILERYIFSPKKHEVFQHLQPLRDRWIKDLQGTSQSFWMIYPLELKTWYLAPVEHKPISNEFLGVTFFRNTTQQLAIQTINGREIWIDQQFVEKMNSEEFAELILHEWVMALYNLRFKKFSEIQSIQTGIASNVDRDEQSKNLKIFDDLIPPEPLRLLNDKDYEKIRYVTHYLFENRQTISGTEAVQFLLNNDFDPRFFNSKLFKDSHSSQASEQLSLKAGELYQIFQTANLSHRLQDTCYFYHFEKSFHCRTTISPQAAANDQAAPQMYRMLIQPSLEVKDSALEISFLSGETSLIQLGSFSIKEHEKYFLSMMLTPYPLTTKIGDPVTQTLFVLRQVTHPDQSISYEVKTMVIQQGVMTSIEEVKKSETGTAASTEKKCKGTSFQPRTLKEDTIILGDKDFALQRLKMFMDNSQMQLFCWP